jgi:uncharacterized protein
VAADPTETDARTGADAIDVSLRAFVRQMSGPDAILGGAGSGAGPVRRKRMKITSYAAGTPCWIDLGVPDVATTVAFYGGLFGWTGEPGPPETGGYVMCLLGGDPVAGIGPLMEGQPSVWNTYFASDDLDDTADRVGKAGGQVMMPPMDIMDIGRMGVFMDSGGATFGAWQKGTFGGAGVVNEPGALIWNELMTRDVADATEFYASALGLGTMDSAAGGDTPYTTWTVGDTSVAGMLSIDNPGFPPDLPPHWMVYFAVADVTASTALAAELGASVSVPPTQMAIGTFSIVSDPAGAFFAMIQMAG